MSVDTHTGTEREVRGLEVCTDHLRSTGEADEGKRGKGTPTVRQQHFYAV